MEIISKSKLHYLIQKYPIVTVTATQRSVKNTPPINTNATTEKQKIIKSNNKVQVGERKLDFCCQLFCFKY